MVSVSRREMAFVRRARGLDRVTFAGYLWRVTVLDRAEIDTVLPEPFARWFARRGWAANPASTASRSPATSGG